MLCANSDIVIDQMKHIVAGLVGRRLMFKDLMDPCYTGFGNEFNREFSRTSPILPAIREERRIGAASYRRRPGTAAFPPPHSRHPKVSPSTPRLYSTA